MERTPQVVWPPPPGYGASLRYLFGSDEDRLAMAEASSLTECLEQSVEAMKNGDYSDCKFWVDRANEKVYDSVDPESRSLQTWEGGE